MTSGLVVLLAWCVVLAQVAMDWPAIRRTHFGSFGQVGLGGLLALRLVGMKNMVGPGVGFSWALLWLGGGRRPWGDWVDRAGTIMGAA